MADDQTIRVYITTVSSTLKVKKQQTKIKDLLESKKYSFELIDISADEQDKLKMREMSGNDKALPPQIFRGETYLGDFEAFDNAVESEALDEFLGICS